MVDGDSLINESGLTCSWEAFTGETEDAEGERVLGYAAAQTLNCIPDQPSYKWLTRWPNAKLAGSLILCLPSTATSVKPLDRITFGSLKYKVVDVAIWPNTAVQAALERITGEDT